MFLSIDLFVMPMIGFDVSLDMDCLADYCAILDCAARTVTFHIPSLPVFQFVAEPRGEPLSSFLAFVIKDSVAGCIEQLPVVCEYPDVFQEIPSLPCRQVEFQIDLVSVTGTVTKLNQLGRHRSRLGSELPSIIFLLPTTTWLLEMQSVLVGTQFRLNSALAGILPS
ncbi:uncharacterized protein LOC131234568 [Magnolia sinica]|uniref:uncharacterized protein LOC131234568 n=1 Tax=Magnolia sinica TaxID=86752 RepID=UPI0026593811|nr:uncharacterized protein LOC131234568 [Magnolia sinica]